MEVLMNLCPGCSDFIDKEGRNILHVAVENKKNKSIEFIFQDESFTNLINQKDKNGNTPIHLFVASDFEKMEMLMDSRVNINARNNEKLTPLDIISSYDQRERLIKTLPDDGGGGRTSFIRLTVTVEDGGSYQMVRGGGDDNGVGDNDGESHGSEVVVGVELHSSWW
ncbi:hypothetical protein L1987_58217 [Smallanthus sonchifolius]|uniref:Uncharacterized protein n=1 Tax=Smallanthus sonchifolius TaxID=185202 RepID=A0ACB9DF55_9ASTR|nr:hypothetical protein L1987_58217 [Smallanthus sonchifolius]